MTARRYAPICRLEECEGLHFSAGYCRKHFERWKRHGDPRKTLLELSPRGAPIAWLREHINHDSDDCLIWPFSRFPDGRAHMNGAFPTRVMCELHHGAPPSPIHEAAHSCGRAYDACVNPRHLRWATPIENAADKETHGTIVRGEAHYAAKLTETDVRRIRALAGTMPQKDIAGLFGVGFGCVSNIINWQSWRHLR